MKALAKPGTPLQRLIGYAEVLMKLLLTLALVFPLLGLGQQAGKFDYYLLSMSWSPEYCYSHQGSPECSRHLGLVVHGLWPQYNNAPRGPEDCGNQPGLSNPGSMLDIMPSVSLVQHEWITHGTCSGLSANDYFGLLRKTFVSFHVPNELQQPTRQSIMRLGVLKRAIEQVNPSLSDSEIALTCTGQYLKEVDLCVNKEGKPQPCSNVHECRAPSLRIPAVR